MTGAASLAGIAPRAADHALMVAGAFHPGPDDGLPDTAGTLILLAPLEPGFWAHVTAQPEWSDGAPDPLDRWSRRVVGRLACDLGGKAHFPFTGPPWKPFYSWALRSGRAWASPVHLLVHDRMGLFASYRGAIAVPDRLDLPETGPRPCDTCADRPCLTTCPAGALGGAGYDTGACHAHLDRPAGADCLIGGCAVRRACPISRAYGRLPEQSAYHMGLFHR